MISLLQGVVCMWLLMRYSCSVRTAESITDYDRDYDCAVLRKEADVWMSYGLALDLLGYNERNV